MAQTLSQSLGELRVDPEIAEAFIRRTQPPRRSYVIWFTARSGSSWLTDLLANTKSFGKPGELFSPKSAATRARNLNANTPSLYFEAVRRRRQTPNGVFGVKMTFAHWRLADGIDVLEAMKDDASFFTLRRRDTLAQGLSLYRMVQSGVAHDKGDGDAHAQGAPVPYDAKEIRRWISHFVGNEESLFDLLRLRRARFIPLVYEDITADAEGVLALFARVVLNRSGGEPLPLISQHRKLARQDDDMKMRFMDEESGFLAEIEARRRAYLDGLVEPPPRALLAMPEIEPVILGPRPGMTRPVQAGQKVAAPGLVGRLLGAFRRKAS
jgi:LPS sulfotransferase NodH